MPTTHDSSFPLELNDRVADLRGKYLSVPPPDASLVRRLGLAVLDHVKLHPLDVVPGAAKADADRTCEAIARRFIEHMLPRPEDDASLNAEARKEYEIALAPAVPEVGRVIVAFALARGTMFAQDRFFKFRSVGYRACSGNPLADHIINHVIWPGVRDAQAAPAS